MMTDKEYIEWMHVTRLSRLAKGTQSMVKKKHRKTFRALHKAAKEELRWLNIVMREQNEEVKTDQKRRLNSAQVFTSEMYVRCLHMFRDHEEKEQKKRRLKRNKT